MSQDLWEQLEGYQDLADDVGIGNEWSVLCAEKTMMAAFACLNKTTELNNTTEAKVPNFEESAAWIISALSANAACLVQAVGALRKRGEK